jgi:hypothetical protein
LDRGKNSGLFPPGCTRQEIIINNPTVPSIWRIIEVDYAALVAVMAPAVLWGLYLIFHFNGRGDSNQVYLMIAAAATVIGPLVLALRVLSIQRLFSDGTAITGQIERVWFYRDRGQVRFTYNFQGEEYHTGSTIHKTKRTQALQEGAPARIMVDQSNPKHALIQELFL